jgi:4-amino-4-deoxy-L-arabinose transferase-like glycosyltransferase
VKQAKDEQNEELEKESILLPIIIVVLFFSLLICLYHGNSWFGVLPQFINWLITSRPSYITIHAEGFLMFFLAGIQIIILGTIISHILLRNEDILLKRATALGLGFGITGLVTVILSVISLLTRTILMTFFTFLDVFLVLIGAFSTLQKFYAKGILKFLVDSFSIWRIGRKLEKSWLILIIPGSIVFFFIYLHSLFHPIYHWDALFYHASRASIMFHEHSFPFIAGSSTGIGMSGNYPPLFSSIGAYFYVMAGKIEETYLQIVTPTMSLLTTLIVYFTGKRFFGATQGLMASFIFLCTPILIYSSIPTLLDTTLMFFLSMYVLFLTLGAIQNTDRTRYWIISALFYGLSLLTSYRALYLSVVCVITFLILIIFKKQSRTHLFFNFAIFIIITITIYSSWGIRNLILFGNPFYPFGGGKYLSNYLDKVRTEELQTAQLIFMFNKPSASLLDWAEFLLWRWAHFPSASLLTLLGFVFVMYYRKLFSTFPFLLWAIIYYFSFIIPLVHERYIIQYLPALAQISALPLTYILITSKCSITKKLVKKKILSLCITLWLIFVFFTAALPISIVGTSPSPYQPPLDPLFGLKTLGTDKFAFLRLFYGEHIRTAEWLENRINMSAKVAIPGEFPPLFKQADVRVLFYLDSPEAVILHQIMDPDDAVIFFSERNIKYIYAPEWVRTSPRYANIPFLSFLGSPAFFPMIYSVGVEKVYQVGPIDDVITRGSKIPVQINFFDSSAWSEVFLVNKTSVRDVIGNSFTPRLLITSGFPLMLIRINYLDKEGFLTFNLHTENKVYLNYAKIVGKNTGQWKTFEFLVHAEGPFIEFGLFASKNFTIAKIEAEPFQFSGRYSVFNLRREITNKTDPPALIFYLPTFRGGERVQTETKSHGRNISIEIFEGVIQHWETTKWWERHRMVARVPELPTYGAQNPTLIWKAEPGIYTLIVVLWDEYSPNARVDLSIVIGGSR